MLCCRAPTSITDGKKGLPKEALTLTPSLTSRGKLTRHLPALGAVPVVDVLRHLVLGNSVTLLDLAFELVETAARVIAHWVPASRQVLSDHARLRSIIDGELLAGLALKEESQLLAGDGTGQNLLGLIPQATAYSAPFTIASATMIDTIGLALLQTALATYQPDGIVMNEADWWRIRLLKDGDGKYIMGPPAADVTPRLFGLDVVPTAAMTADKFMVGSFKRAATIYDRWLPRVEASNSHEDFFTRNMVAILAEQPLALGVKRPAALIYGDFGNAP